MVIPTSVAPMPQVKPHRNDLFRCFTANTCRVVPATRDSFERCALPSEASYIIYEYIRGDGEEAAGERCQVVLSSVAKA